MAKRKPLTPIQESARGEKCTFNLEGCKYGTDTTVLAHDTRYIPDSPRKCDMRAAYACVNCHDIVDGRKNSSIKPFEMGYEWGRAIGKTHVKLIQKELIKVAGIEPGLPKQLPRTRI